MAYMVLYHQVDQCLLMKSISNRHIIFGDLKHPIIAKVATQIKQSVVYIQCIYASYYPNPLP
jgi:hypothetical protein